LDIKLLLQVFQHYAGKVNEIHLKRQLFLSVFFDFAGFFVRMNISRRQKRGDVNSAKDSQNGWCKTLFAFS